MLPGEGVGINVKGSREESRGVEAGGPEAKKMVEYVERPPKFRGLGVN